MDFSDIENRLSIEDKNKLELLYKSLNGSGQIDVPYEIFMVMKCLEYTDDGYLEKMSFSDFLDLPIHSSNLEERTIIEEINDKFQRPIQNTFIENRVLNIDITQGIDNIIEMINNNYDNIEQIIIFADNDNYVGLERLTELGKKIKISYIYNEMVFVEPILLDDFINMRKFINSIVHTIKELQLTPVEEILALYEFVKWYQYNFDDKNQKNAQYIHSFVRTGEIVCAAYSKLFAQVAKELGHNSFVCLIDSERTTTGIGHERNAIYVDDSHYGIKGLYYLDVTFDTTQLDDIGEKYGVDVQKSNLFYQFFLFNYNQYKCLFKDELNPVKIEDVNYLLPFVQHDFVNINEDDLLVIPREIDLQVIKKIYKNVMLKQRINSSQIEERLDKFDEHNKIQREILIKNNEFDSKGFRR